ncbi:hypothetical protein AXG93_1480s1090 [Marchantia polymorpha subsp. ruderalis]|uniref:Macrophage erythroblast attacher n=1 Tax=Marchantia polymorpha subsp. ruderalis TaxID=1480154 RepID=A0A176W0V9_MARPO|nr:hypothetical protein AXG93_1480s1090 [Marchantia polymorpha subsp. ruderalis]
MRGRRQKTPSTCSKAWEQGGVGNVQDVGKELRGASARGGKVREYGTGQECQGKAKGMPPQKSRSSEHLQKERFRETGKRLSAPSVNEDICAHRCTRGRGGGTHQGVGGRAERQVFGNEARADCRAKMMDGETASNGITPASTPGPSPALRLNDHPSESVKLEHQLVRVPYEHLKKSMRATTRLVEKEVSAVVAGVAEAVDKEMSKEEAVQHLTSLVSRLQGLKRKLDESNKNEQGQVQRCRARLDHLSILRFGSKEAQLKWNHTRVERILVDYMLRSSYYDTAVKLAESANIQAFCNADVHGTTHLTVKMCSLMKVCTANHEFQESSDLRGQLNETSSGTPLSFLTDLADIDIFLDARKVFEALENRDCTEALAWCAENKSKLKKAKSKFEFKLRLQEFIELVRSEKMMEAIMYARKHLAPWGSTNMKELQQAMATLAFKSNTDCASYKILFDVKQWDNLVQQFTQEFYKLYGMTMEPLLNIHLQAGLSALKTPSCYEEGCTKEDPLLQESFRQLAEPLPFSKHVHSKLVCFISKELMNEDNPPLVLPNGYVYSRKAMEEMAKNNQGRITCPRTGHSCNFVELSKAYIS